MRVGFATLLLGTALLGSPPTPPGVQPTLVGVWNQVDDPDSRLCFTDHGSVLLRDRRGYGEITNCSYILGGQSVRFYSIWGAYHEDVRVAVLDGNRMTLQQAGSPPVAFVRRP